MIFYIALKDLIITFKDRRSLMMMLLMPILIIMILGSAFSGTFSREISISKFSIAVVNNDGEHWSKIFADEVLTKGGSDMFTTELLTEKEAQTKLEKKQISSIVTIPKDFSKGIDSNKPVKIEVKSLSDDKLKAMIVESMSSGFAKGISLNSASISAAIDVSQEIKLPFDINELQNKLKDQGLAFKVDAQKKNKNVSAIQYYSAGMLLMFILFGANQGAKLMIEERETKTLGRIMISCAGRTNIIIGKFLGLFMICLMQAIILISFTGLIYGVSWGGSILGIILITLCSVFAGAGMFMFIASISKTARSADGFAQIFIQVFTILGGGMVPLYIMPKAMQMIAKVTINWWGMKGYLDLMTGINSVYMYCGILILMGIIYLAVGIRKFRVE